MLDRTQSLSRKVEHLPTPPHKIVCAKPSAAPDHGLLNQPLVFTQKFSQKTNSPKQMEKTKSGLVD